MYILYSILALLLVLIVFATGRGVLLYQKSQELVERSEPFTQEGENPNKQILVLGDSTAVGTGASDPQYSVAGRLGDMYPDARVENWAVNGNKLADVLEQVKTKDLEQYDLVLLQVGANDIIFHTPLAEARSSARQLLDAVTPHAEHIAWIVSGNIGLAPFFPQPFGWYLERRTQTFHRAFKEVAKEKDVVFVDLYEKRANDPFSKDPAKYYAPDFLHLSDAGYEVWFGSLIDALPEQAIE